MKRIDLHIHTVSTSSDSDFTFSKAKLLRYVETSGLDAIAVTNHNTFDESQFRDISTTLSIPAFPGIEINLEKCHLLLISDGDNVSEFASMAGKVTQAIQLPTDSITVEKLKTIFGDLHKYLLIPHYEKKPSIQASTLAAITDYVSAGEVDSAKKFIRAAKDPTALTPVLFSDARITDQLANFPTRHTFIDCGELTLSAIKACLEHKTKVSLSANDGNTLFQIFDDGQLISTGLNVVLGERSSGKTYTLNRIADTNGNVKYIRQFELVQQDGATYEREFKSDLERRRSTLAEEYLQGFKSIVDDVMNVDLTANEREVEEYLETLLKSAEDADRKDAYSSTALFNETALTASDDTALRDLIQSVRQLIENVDHRDIITKHVDLAALRRLACELIELLWDRTLQNKKTAYVNEVIKDVRQRLKLRSSAVQVEDVDLFKVALDSMRVKRFNEIVKMLKQDAVIFEETIQNFRVIARKRPYSGASEVKAAIRTQTAFSGAMKVYDDPYAYLQELMGNENLAKADLYRLFAKISFEILNRHGAPVSGGERSEFRLLQEIKDAQNFDLLLIDEPESSFDNMFLYSEVNEILREIAKVMPVVVVTHNSTVGASIRADYALYARKQEEADDVNYKLYSGHPTDKTLRSTDGDSIANHEILMDSLEAGHDAYEGRRKHYEAVAD